MKKTNTNFVRQSSILILLLILGVIVRAQPVGEDNKIPQDTNDTIVQNLDEVVITATKIPQRIIDIPYSVTRLNYSDYKYDRTIGSNDILSATPGLFLQSRYGDHDVRFSIRGFGSRSNSGVRGVRILLDDMPESEPDGQTRLEALDFNAIRHIEIVRGNASSLYTNAPGGVVNFFNDLEFEQSSFSLLNQFGSYGLWKSGFLSTVKQDNYKLLTSYSYINYNGYRQHNNENWSILNIDLEINPTPHTSLKVLGYYVDGMIKLPGSLTKEQFDADPLQADPKSINRDEKRITKKGRLGIRYDAVFGKHLTNEIEVTAYGTIKNFDRTAKEYRIINRDGFGISGKYTLRHSIFKMKNEITLGGDLYAQPARIEYYDNYHGTKGDQINQLISEDVNNKGLFLSDNLEVWKEKVSLLLTCRYDNIYYGQKEETLPSRMDSKKFNAVTPKFALNYKLSPHTALFGSYGLSFDSPALNELESADPTFLYNQNLAPQTSNNMEVGIKGYTYNWDRNLLRKIQYEATLFDILIYDEIIPYEILGEVFYRNAAKTNRFGVELGTTLEVFKDFDVAISYTYSYFKYLEYSALSIDQDSTGKLVENLVDYTGNFAPSVPMSNFYISMSYSKSIHKNISLFAKLSYMGISGLWVNDANSAKTGTTNLLNSILGCDVRFGRWNLLLSGGINNLLNQIYVGFTNTNSADRHFYEAGAPRDYFCNINVGYTFK